MIAGTVISVEQIAALDKCSIRQVPRARTREAAIEGRLPRGIGITRLRDARFVDLIRRRSAKEGPALWGSTDDHSHPLPENRTRML
jgi:hypothetical protein